MKRSREVLLLALVVVVGSYAVRLDARVRALEERPLLVELSATLPPVDDFAVACAVAGLEIRVRKLEEGKSRK